MDVLEAGNTVLDQSCSPQWKVYHCDLYGSVQALKHAQLIIPLEQNPFIQRATCHLLTCAILILFDLMSFEFDSVGALIHCITENQSKHRCSTKAKPILPLLAHSDVTLWKSYLLTMICCWHFCSPHLVAPSTSTIWQCLSVCLHRILNQRVQQSLNCWQIPAKFLKTNWSTKYRWQS